MTHNTLFFAVPFVLLSLFGCGRKATEADCDLIIDRNIEVQMKSTKVDRSAEVAKVKEDIRAAMKDERKSCVGRRVTDGMMNCVKGASTADELDRCMR